MSNSNYLKPDLLDTSRVTTGALVTDLVALAAAAVGARSKNVGSADVEIALQSLQTATDALARLHL